MPLKDHLILRSADRRVSKDARRPGKRPWRDNSGRLSLLKLTVFVALFAPGVWTLLSYPLDLLGARPLNEAIHQIGLWTIRDTIFPVHPSVRQYGPTGTPRSLSRSAISA